MSRLTKIIKEVSIPVIVAGSAFAFGFFSGKCKGHDKARNIMLPLMREEADMIHLFQKDGMNLMTRMYDEIIKMKLNPEYSQTSEAKKQYEDIYMQLETLRKNEREGRERVSELIGQYRQMMNKGSE